MGQSGPCLEYQLPAAARRDRLGRRGGADPGAASVDLAAHVGPSDLADLAGLGHDRVLAPGKRGYSGSPRAAVLAAAQTTLHNTGDITEAFMAGTDRFLQESARPEIQRLLLTDGPAALGWDRWYELDARHGMAQITLGFEGLIAAGVIARQPVAPLAHIWHGATLGAARSIATADDPERALQDASDCLRQLLSGLRQAATTEPAGTRPDDVR